MIIRTYRFLFLYWIASALVPLVAEEIYTREESFHFLDSYCLQCHDSDTEKGDRNFETFDLPLQTESDLIAARDIVDQITLGEMPPKKSDQPSEEDRLKIVRALRQEIALAKGKINSSNSRTVMRRLSNREYQNTLESLFGRRVDTLGLTADFPKDQTSHHMDNIGKALVTSGFQLDQYFQAANRLVETRLNKPQIEPKEWHFKDNFVQYEELKGPHKAAFKYRYLCLYEQPNTDTRQGGYGHIEDFLEGVPVSGLYQIKVLAQAMHRDTHYDPEIFKIDFSEPFILGIVPGDRNAGHIHYPQPIEPILAQTVVPDKTPEWLEFTVWLEAGQTPRFIFPNGPYESRASVIAINKRYKDEFKNPGISVTRTHLLREGALPRIQIDEIKIRGPLKEPGGGKEEQAIFGKEGFNAETALEKLYQFANRAYRRPLNDKDRKRIGAIYNQRIAEKAAPRQAALDSLKLILCSPSFLYFSEITEEKNPKLKAHDLATRLSYTLWARPPDAKLRNAASKEKLVSDEKRYLAEIDRLLKHEQSEGFVEGFLDSWLNLRELGGMPPPRRAARVYYYEALPKSMKEETHFFFKDLLKRNGSVANFLDSDYAFVDKKLANLYQLPEGKTMKLLDGFQKVSIKNNYRRGGLLGMAAVLTVSANGVETSPVTRGVWVSENLLGIVPPPPPDEVPEIEPDVRGTTTVRERLEKHREIATCAECHRKIDPLGFSLESFDPIGRWRVNYPKTNGQKATHRIDPSGIFPSGEKFNNIGEFRTLLAEKRLEPFTRNLIETFLTYATGRHMEIGDQFEIDDVLARVQKEGYGLKTLIVECLKTDIFRNR